MSRNLLFLSILILLSHRSVAYSAKTPLILLLPVMGLSILRYMVMMPELDAIFIANGPSFKKGFSIKAFENMHVFPLLLELLELNANDEVDGDITILSPKLKTTSNVN